MNTAVRLCIAVAMHAMTVAHAGLETFWTHRFTSPTLTYSVQATRYDAKGDVIVAGTVTEAATGSDLWMVKLNGATGALQWTFRKDGLTKSNDKLGNIAISPEGDIYVAGALANEPATAGPPGLDAYLARIDGASGEARWEVDGLGNFGDDAWHNVALDAGSNPVVTGVITNPENNLGGEIWTAKFDAVDGGMKWDATHFAFETNILDQGERLFISPEGDVYVQGWHAPGTFLQQNYGPTVQVLSYKEDGTFRWATRFREAPNARAYGFEPAAGGGFIVGLFEVSFAANIPVITVATGKTDGTFGIEKPLPSVRAAPFIGLAANGDILFTGRDDQPAVEQMNVVSGRLAPDDLSTHWVRSLPAPGGSPGAGFAHIDYGEVGSIVAGIAPGGPTLDLALATYTLGGEPLEALFLDGADEGAEVPDLPPMGPALDINVFGEVAVSVSTLGPEGEREVLARGLRETGVSNPPTIIVSSPDPADPNVDAFTEFTFSVLAFDAQKTAVTVEFFADGASLGVVPIAPFEVPHTFLTTGTHTLEAVATNAAGAKASTGPITVIAHVPTPVVSTGGAQRTGATTGSFSGAVSNLPLGGTARFLFGLTGATPGFGFSTASVNLPPNKDAQPVSIPFTFPEPHRSYDYFLEVTATDGAEVVTAGSPPQSFLIPNAPVLAVPDIVFVPRGVIGGNPLANDFDGDAGEVLTVTYGGGPFPGLFVTKGNAFTFAPGRDFTGELIVPYTVDDGHGSTVSETLVIRNGRHYAGTYRALPPVDSLNLGAVDVTVNHAGRATVAVFLNGARFAVSGELSQQEKDAVGFSVLIRKKNQPDRELQLSWTPERDFFAQLSEVLPVSEFSPLTELPQLSQGLQVLYTAEGVRAGISAFPLPQVYTLAGTHTNVSGNAEGRVSAFASLQIAPDGKSIFRGKLGDGTPFVSVSRTREDGQLPIYTPLRGRPTSFLIGLIQPNVADAATVAPGMAAVLGPATRRAPAYAADYRDLVAFSGSRYVPPAIGGSPLTFTESPRMVTLETVGGGFAPFNFSLPVWVSRTGTVSGITGITRIALDARTGELSGAFLPEGRRRTLPFSGVLQPGENGGFGVFRGVTAMGEIQIAPR